MLSQNLRWSLFAPGDRVLVAVSGGPDSLSLMHVLWTEGEARGLDRTEAAHLDHGLRGDESAAEAAWVATWCAGRGIPCHVGQADVAEMERERKVGKQQAARLARYAFLEEVAATIGATKIATAHTQDDQTETVLMNVLRGTGIDGLRGIPERRGLFIRPLLDVSRAEIEAYCAAQGLEPRRDPSNLSPDTYTRNHIRLELLPQLERDYNPGVRQALLRLSEIAGRDAEYLAEQAKAALAEATREHDAVRLTLDRPTLAALHPALLRHVLRRAIAEFRGTGAGVTYDHLETLCASVTAIAPQAFGLTLPSPLCIMRVTKETLTLTLANVPSAPAPVSVPLLAPGEVTLPEMGWTIHASFDALPTGIVLDADAVHGEPLMLRHWQQGDRIDPLGMGGRHKKVSDLFSDAKVPLTERHRIPIIADFTGILWIVGHCMAERAKVTPETKKRLYLGAAPLQAAGWVPLPGGVTTHPASV